MPNEFGEAALRYAKLGLAVIPLMEHGKKPIFERWPEVATADVGMVTRWWSQNPACNVGIATGQKSHVFVLDVDPANGGQESYDKLISEHGQFPNTWQQITGGGGFHIFFRYPAFRVANAASFLPGLDIRGDGGQVVAPPSIHPDTGRRYEWDGLREIEQTPLAEAPLWLLELLQKRIERPHSDSFPLVMKIPKGVQHKTLVSLAGMLRKLGLDENEIYPTLQKVNETRCTEPGTAENISQIAHSMMNYRPSDTGLISMANRLWRETHQAEDARKKREEKNGVGVVDGLTVYRSNVVDNRCVVDGVLFNGLTVFAGRPKVGKSWLALQLALSVSHGGRFLGSLEVMRPGRVVYAALEESQSRTAARMRKVQPAEDIMLQNISMVYELSPLMHGGSDQLDQLLGTEKPNLVVVDTFLSLVGGMNSGKKDVMRSDYAEINVLHKLAEQHDTAIVLVHHMRKGQIGETGLDAVGGSTGITAAADAIWAMKREDVGVCSLEVIAREAEEQTIALKFMQGDCVGWELMGTGEQVKDMKDEREIYTLLREEGALAPGKAAMMLKMNANRCRSVIYAMHQRGLVHRNASGTYYADPSGGE